MFNKKSSYANQLTVKLKISNSGGQNINIIKPSFEVNIQNHHGQNNNNNISNNNYININNPVFNNIQCKHSRNVDNIFNNPTDIMNKLSVFKQSSDKTNYEDKKKTTKDPQFESHKAKSSSTNHKVGVSTVDHIANNKQHRVIDKESNLAIDPK